MYLDLVCIHIQKDIQNFIKNTSSRARWAYRRMLYILEERDRRKRKEILNTFT